MVETKATISNFVGNTTNNVAEYTGLVLGLEKAIELGIKQVHVYMDSELIVRQMNGIYESRMKNCCLYSSKRAGWLLNFLHLRLSHVRREKNKIADQLANQAMDQAQLSR